MSREKLPRRVCISEVVAKSLFLPPDRLFAARGGAASAARVAALLELPSRSPMSIPRRCEWNGIEVVVCAFVLLSASFAVSTAAAVVVVVVKRLF